MIPVQGQVRDRIGSLPQPLQQWRHNKLIHALYNPHLFNHGYGRDLSVLDYIKAVGGEIIFSTRTEKPQQESNNPPLPRGPP